MLMNYLVVAAVLGATSAANAECISVAELKSQNPNTSSYVHETKRGENRAVSVYRKGESFEEFIEVIRDGRCIVSTETLTVDQFVSRYLELPEPWIMELEAADNEGMEGAEGEALGDPYSMDEPGNMSSPKETSNNNVIRPGKGDDYEDINVSALTDLYEAYLYVRACFEARRGLSPVYIKEPEMRNAETAFKRAEAEILRRNSRIDKDAIWRVGKSNTEYFTNIVIVDAKFKVNYKMYDACRQALTAFPPDVNNTVLRREPRIDNKPNTGGGLIVPQDPRFAGDK